MSIDRTKEFLEASKIKQIAILTLQQDTEQAIADQLNMTLGQVKHLKKSNRDEFLAILQEETERAAEVLRARFRKRLEKAESHAWETFLYHLKEKKTLDAVKMYAEMIGLKAPAAKDGDGQPAITIVYPEQVQTKDLGKAVDVTPEEK